MKTKVSICSVFVVIVLIFAINPYAFSWPPDGKYPAESKKHREVKEHFNKVFEQLNLTPEQKQKLEENKNKYKEEANRLREEIHNKKELLREELAKPELDMNKITQIHNDLKTVLLKMEDLRLEGILEVRKILTPEQLNKFNKKMKKFGKEKRGFRKYRRE
ncbi:MAG: Spy/CpxP family protein refolding chaperone [Thermodesulfobacteriota bacterium]